MNSSVQGDSGPAQMSGPTTQKLSKSIRSNQNHISATQTAQFLIHQLVSVKY